MFIWHKNNNLKLNNKLNFISQLNKNKIEKIFFKEKNDQNTKKMH